MEKHTSATNLFRTMLSEDLAAKSAGKHLLDQTDFRAKTMRHFINVGLVAIERDLAMDIGALNGMAGDW